MSQRQESASSKDRPVESPGLAGCQQSLVAAGGPAILAFRKRGRLVLHLSARECRLLIPPIALELRRLGNLVDEDCPEMKDRLLEARAELTRCVRENLGTVELPPGHWMDVLLVAQVEDSRWSSLHYKPLEVPEHAGLGKLIVALNSVLRRVAIGDRFESAR